MTIRRIVAIVCIFLLACGGWSVLGTATAWRSHEASEHLEEQVVQLWGGPLRQEAPQLCMGDGENFPVCSSEVEVSIDSDYRKKGLIWYPTFRVRFQAHYTFVVPQGGVGLVHIALPLPSRHSTYENITMLCDDEVVDAVDLRQGFHYDIMCQPGTEHSFDIAFTTRGLSEWMYVPNQSGKIRQLSLTANCHFMGHDYPEGSLSPTSAEVVEGGSVVRWKMGDMLTHKHIGIQIPELLNPGPITTRITYFAPVCLIFFFVLMAAVNILRAIPIHPMHYLFIASGFFAFHLLLAYLVDVIDIHVAFAISAVTSTLMVNVYLKTALGSRFPWLGSTVGQLIYLILFSYSFFIDGLTGLTVAIGSVITLAVMMRLTAHIDWNTVFQKGDVDDNSCSRG